jgi:TonB family protein
MIRPLFLSLLLLTTASMVALAQNADSSSSPMPPSIACSAADWPPSQTPHKKITVSTGVMTGKKIRGKNPKYPHDAKKARIQGRVVLRAFISESGDVVDLCVVQGPVMLQQASLDAVKTWKYKPIVIDGQPVEVRTQINLDFKLR